MSYHSIVTEILSGLWLGDITSAYDESFIHDKQITMLINCTNENKYPVNDIITIKHHMDIFHSQDIANIYQTLVTTASLIATHINTDNILVYCQTGTTSSATVILLYLLKYGQLDLQLAIDCMVSKRPEVMEMVSQFPIIFKYLKKIHKN